MIKYQKKIILFTLAIFSFNCSAPLYHKVIDNFPDGSMKSISIFKGSSLIQKIEFSDDGNILSRTLFEDNCLAAKWTSADFFDNKDMVSNYYNNGVLKSQGYIVENNLHGHWSYYNRDGSLESNRYYFHGEPVGDWYSYHNNQMEVTHKGYIKGNGNWIEYYNAELHLSTGSNLLKKEISFFNNNKLTGLYEYYYKNGFVKISGYYDEGKKDGVWSFYSEKGKLVKVENYKKGQLDGDFKLFFEDGITEKLIGKYKNNERSETWFWFFDIDKKSNLKINYSK